MGCCFSSTSNTSAPTSMSTDKIDQKSQNPFKPYDAPLKSPIIQSHKSQPLPPPPEEDEEETVIKEVLVFSETPVLQNKPEETITQTSLTPQPKTQTDVAGPSKKQQQQQQQQEREQEPASYLSQLSEIYSISETISATATTTTTATTATATNGLKEDEATSKDNSQVKHRSPTKVRKKSPSNGDPSSVRARRVDPSPERARGRGRGLGEVRNVQRNVGSRSRSPGSGRAGGVGRGAAGKSPTRVTGKNNSKPIDTATVEDQSKREEDGNGEELEQQQGTESLENPLVSLECFIFL